MSDPVAEQARQLREEQEKWIGKVVLFNDELRQQHYALINQCWSLSDKDNQPIYINLVYVSGDSTKTDQYGRQIERSTSVYRKDQNNAAGRNFELLPV
jgi:hypothetical protein